MSSLENPTAQMICAPVTNILDQKIVVDADDLVRLGILFVNATRLRLEAEGRFPKRLCLASRRICYLSAEIKQWVAARAAERDQTMAERSGAAKRGVETRRRNGSQNGRPWPSHRQAESRKVSPSLEGSSVRQGNGDERR